MKEERPTQSFTTLLKPITDIASIVAALIAYLVALFGIGDSRFSKTTSLFTIILTSVIVVSWRWRIIRLQKKKDSPSAKNRSTAKTSLLTIVRAPFIRTGSDRYIMPLIRRRVEGGFLASLICFTVVWAAFNTSAAYTEWTSESDLVCNEQRSDGQYRIVVAGLYEAGGQETLLTSNNIYEALQDDPMQVLYQVCRLSKSYKLSTQAQQAAVEYKADILIWGTSDVNFEYHLEVPSLADSQKNLSKVAINEAASPEFQLSQPDQINFATQFAIAELLLVDGQIKAGQKRLTASLLYAESNQINNKDLAEGYYLLGLFYDPHYSPAPDITKSIGAYSEALKADAVNYPARLNRGYLYSNQEMREEAFNDFTYLIENGNEDFQGLGYLNRSFLQDDPADAIKDLNAAIKVNPADGDLYYFRGLAYMKNGDISKAIADYEQAVLLDPEIYENYETLGQAQLQAGDEAGARETFSEMIPYLTEEDRDQVIKDMEKFAIDHPEKKSIADEIIDMLKKSKLKQATTP